MRSSFDIFKDELYALDKADWSEVEMLVIEGNHNSAIEALLPIVPSAARSYVKAINTKGIDFDDLIGVGSLAIVEAVHSWKTGGIKLRNWCYSKVGRDMGRYVGKELSYITQYEEELPDEHEQEPADASIPVDEVIQSEQVRELIRKELDPREIYITELVYFQGRSIAEIAVIEGVSKQAISKVHQRVLIKLRKGVDEIL